MKSSNFRAVVVRRCAASARWLAALSLLTLCASFSLADTCAREPHAVLSGSADEVEYVARRYSEGHRFSVGGHRWELVRTDVIDTANDHRYAVFYPALRDSSRSAFSRDFFVSVQLLHSEEAACSDVFFRSENPIHRLQVSDVSKSAVGTDSFSQRAEHLESSRKLSTEMRVRAAGSEVVITTGLWAQRTLDISDCVQSEADSYGFVEYEPGRLQITCFPANPRSKPYVDEIEWQVEYQWPQDPPELIDDLIDYVYVEPLN